MNKLISIIIVLVGFGVAKANNLEVAIAKTAFNHGLDAAEFRAVLVVESRLQLSAVNRRTLDYGIGQINHKTAKALNLDIVRLTTDLQYSLNAAATVLASMKRYDRANYICRYNVGNGVLIGKRASNCSIYKTKVMQALQTPAARGYASIEQP